MGAPLGLFVDFRLPLGSKAARESGQAERKGFTEYMRCVKSLLISYALYFCSERRRKQARVSAGVLSLRAILPCKCVQEFGDLFDGGARSPVEDDVDRYPLPRYFCNYGF